MSETFTIEQEKIYFLKNQFWASTISASFARAKVYLQKPEEAVSEEKKVKFKNELFLRVEKIINNYYLTQDVTPEKHNQQILEIKDWSINHSTILNGGKLKFGVAQKLLNLYLKYLWCAGIIEYTPPHFPLDRLIQENKVLINWTDLDSLVEYDSVIEKLHPETDKANWELIKYNTLLRK